MPITYGMSFNFHCLSYEYNVHINKNLYLYFSRSRGAGNSVKFSLHLPSYTTRSKVDFPSSSSCKCGLHTFYTQNQAFVFYCDLYFCSFVFLWVHPIFLFMHTISTRKFFFPLRTPEVGSTISRVIDTIMCSTTWTTPY